MSKKLLIACGGTGGHLAPGIAVAEEMLARGHHCCLLISEKQVDSRLVQKYGHLNFVRLPGVAFGKRPVQLCRFAGGFIKGLLRGSGIVKRERPDLVLAFGGFLSLGVVLSARLRRIPVALHEANRKPGRAVRVLRRFADRIYLPPGIALSGVPVSKVRDFGYPVRQEFCRQDPSTARQKLGLGKEGVLLTVFGGSQGASALNEWVNANSGVLLEEGISIFCVRGLGKGEDGVVRELGAGGQKRQMVSVGFCDSMHWALSAADLVISRAGAGSIAEMTRCCVPSILIPYPFAADNHQHDNALYFESQGGSILLEQKDMDRLLDETLNLVRNPDLLEKMRRKLIRIEEENRTGELISDLEELAGEAKEGLGEGVGDRSHQGGDS